VSFKVSDGKLSDYQTIAVTVKEPSSSGSSGGGGSGGGGSGGGGGSSSGSGESYENVEFKDYSIRYVMKDRETIYSFTKEDSIITNVSLTTRLNGGQTKTVVESLKGTSTLARKAAPGKVYRNVNIWVGDEKFSPESISDANVEFRVEKEWIQASNVDAASIELLRYADGAWEQLSTSGLGEDGNYVYYTADVPEFSVFAISSVDESDFAEDGEGNESNDDENSTMSLDDAIDSAGSASATQERRSSGIVYIAIIGLTALGIVSYRYRVSLGKTIAQLGNPDGKRYRRFKR
jgi:PGF-pre-PGF domain-containing protein